MALHSRKRDPSPIYPVTPLPDRWKQSNEPILSKCPYPGGSGCFHLWTWAAVVESHCKDPAFKPSMDDWMLFRPTASIRESLAEYGRQSSLHRISGGSIEDALNEVEKRFDDVLEDLESTAIQARYLKSLRSLCKTIYEEAETIAENVGLLLANTDQPAKTITSDDAPRKGVPICYVFWAQVSESVDIEAAPSRKDIAASVNRFRKSPQWKNRKFKVIGGSDLWNNPGIYDPDALLECYASYEGEPVSSRKMLDIKRQLHERKFISTRPPRPGA